MPSHPGIACGRPANPWLVQRACTTEIGVGFSGTLKELKVGDEAGLLKVDIAQVQPDGFQGLASVEVTVKDVTAIALAEGDVANGVVMLDVTWQSGIAGGEMTVDATRGTCFAVGGMNAVNIRARWASADGGPIKIAATKRLEATVHWLGSISPKAAKVTLPSVTLAGGGAASAWLPIPLQAESMIALSTVPASLPGLIAEFSGANGAAGVGSTRYRTLNPNANGTPIVAGVEFVRFTGPDAMVVTPVFELWE